MWFCGVNHDFYYFIKEGWAGGLVLLTIRQKCLSCVYDDYSILEEETRVNTIVQLFHFQASNRLLYVVSNAIAYLPNPHK